MTAQPSAWVTSFQWWTHRWNKAVCFRRRVWAPLRTNLAESVFGDTVSLAGQLRVGLTAERVFIRETHSVASNDEKERKHLWSLLGSSKSSRKCRRKVQIGRVKTFTSWGSISELDSCSSGLGCTSDFSSPCLGCHLWQDIIQINKDWRISAKNLSNNMTSITSTRHTFLFCD